MASLYLAYQPPSRDIVAVKVIRSRLRDDSSVHRMFEDEVRTLTHVRHKNVVRVLGSGEYPDGRFMAMEYLHGCSLARLRDELERRDVPLPVELVAYLGVQVATALHAAHEAVDSSGRPLGIVHRDVSPQNVMISENGRVKLIDFGVAKAEGRREVTNAKMVVKGKLRYMAPEQVSGQPLDRRTDLFALGIVLWESLTHRKFAARDGEADLFTRLMDPKATPPSEDNEAVPPALDAIIVSLLQREPDDRPTSGLVLAEQLAEAVALEGAAEQLRALVDEMFGIELAYTRKWICDSFQMPEDEWLEEAAASVTTETTTQKMGRDVLAALAARKIAQEAQDELELVESKSWTADEIEGSEPTSQQRRLGKKRLRQAAQSQSKKKNLDLTFSLARPRGLNATGAQPLAKPFDGPVTLPHVSGEEDPFDAGNDTDNLAMRCLTSLRQASWAERPAGAPPSMTLISSLDDLADEPPAPPPEKPASSWMLLLAVTLIVLVGSLGITLILLAS